MIKNVTRKPRQWARALVRWAKKQHSVLVLVRAQVIALAARGSKVSQITETLGCVRSHVYRTIERFVDGECCRESLLDGRSSNGHRLADEGFDAAVSLMLFDTPQEYGFMRPTWTRELLRIVANEQVGVLVSVTTIGRTLRRVGARLGRPKPVVKKCPLSDRQRRRRLGNIRKLIQNLPEGELVFYQDEVDIHLNPKIGLDWMHCGHQREVITPGQNAKAYLAGALNAQDGSLIYEGGYSKDSALFIRLMQRLDRECLDARRIHLILDNYSIHHSHATKKSLVALPRISLHFLPPYCPDDNRIERVWQDLHANVTRNHRHTRLPDLCADVGRWLDARSASPQTPCPLLRIRS